MPHISLVFREMWDTTALNLKLLTPHERLTLRFVVSHISRKTSEIWGTPRSYVRTESSGEIRGFTSTLVANNLFPATLRDHVSRSRQRGNLVLLAPQKDAPRPAPKPPERRIVIENLWRIAKKRAIPEVGRTAVENAHLPPQIEPQGRARFVLAVDLHDVAGLQPGTNRISQSL